MRNYELTVVLDPKSTAAKKKAVFDKVVKLVEINKGKVGITEDWGEKGSGVLLFFPLELDSASVKSINDKIKAEEDIERFLLIKNG